MKKNKLEAVLISDITSQGEKPRNLQVTNNKDVGLCFINFDATLQRLNVVNRNGRNYGGQYADSINDPRLKELMNSGNLMGEAGHPIGFTDAPLARIATVDPKNVSHKIKSLSLRGDIIEGNLETLDNGLHGTSMTRMMLQGMIPSFSVRALTNVTRGPNGVGMVHGPSRIVTFDWVVLPSHKEAYLDKNKPAILMNKSSDAYVQESSGIMIPIDASLASDIAVMESENLKSFYHMMDTDLGTFTLSNDMKHAYVTENTGVDGLTNRYVVPIEDKVADIARDLLSSLY